MHGIKQQTKDSVLNITTATFVNVRTIIYNHWDNYYYIASLKKSLVNTRSFQKTVIQETT